MPSAATPLVYTGGYVSGASRAITEPLLTNLIGLDPFHRIEAEMVEKPD